MTTKPTYEELEQRVAALQERTDFLDKIIESAALSTWISDEKGTAIRTNPACLAFFGATEEEVVGKYNLFKDVVIEKQGVMPDIKRVFEKGEVANILIDYDFSAVDHVAVKKATHKIVNSIFTPILDSKGRVSNVIVQTIDLTDIKNTEEALRESEKRLIEAQHIAKIGYFTWDVETGEVTWSDELFDLLQYDKSEKIDYATVNEQIHHPDDLKRVTQWINDCIASGKAELAPNEYRLIRKDGKILYVHTVGVIERQEGKSTKVFATLQDITERKQAEDALREREGKYSSLVESTEDSIYLVDRTSTYLFMNEKHLSRLGLQPDELLGRTYGDFHSEDDTQAFSAIVEKVFQTGRPNQQEHRSLRDDSYFLRTLSPVKDPGDNTISVTVVSKDITELVRSQDALRESEERFRLLASSSPVGIFQADSEGNGIYVNEKVREFTGFTQEEHFGDEWSKAIYPDDREDVFREWRRMIEGDGGFKTEFRFLSSGGVVTWVSSQAALLQDDSERKTGFIGTLTDITERKLFEEALSDSENRYREILENVLVGVYQVTLDGKFIFANQKMIQMFGYSSYEELGAIGGIAELYAKPEERAEVVDEIISKGFINKEVEYKHKNGQSVWVKLHTRKSKNKEGAIILEGLAEDVTEIREIEAQLQQSQKMEAVGTLASGVAHDFNNILTTIIGNAELALMEVDKDGPLREEIEDIRVSGKRAASLTRQLLAFSRKQIVQPKILDLNELLTDIGKMLRRLIGEDVELLTLSELELWQVEADPGQMEQVIMNLAINAKDAMPKGGKLTIETANVDLDENYFGKRGVREKQLRSYVMLTASDTGMGMDKETQERIFEPFFSTKEIGKGTGLGLSTIYGIVKQNNGFIWVYSEPGQGSTFKIYLPKATGDAEPIEGKRTSITELGGSETILIVEDDDGLRKLARTVLEKRGYKVLEAENGEDALRVVETYDGSIDLMITDVVMPKMGGREAAERLQLLYPQIKVIYMSGYTDNAITHHGVLAPGLSFLQKPFTQEGLAHKVWEILSSE